MLDSAMEFLIRQIPGKAEGCEDDRYWGKRARPSSSCHVLALRAQRLVAETCFAGEERSVWGNGPDSRGARRGGDASGQEAGGNRSELCAAIASGMSAPAA